MVSSQLNKNNGPAKRSPGWEQKPKSQVLFLQQSRVSCLTEQLAWQKKCFEYRRDLLMAQRTN